ncbi:hypothetical protein CYY_000785 [Polysphondylium violaceum]|uniref:Uncharacterized protein n=1 Tax=Polysphondylium violaceum TaxID=133409 RepID=A0A8J4Q459_9MYCE|nr:hypothetical protein CYY_000785 [Polysphondylium violaceum]
MENARLNDLFIGKDQTIKNKVQLILGTIVMTLFFIKIVYLFVFEERKSPGSRLKKGVHFLALVHLMFLNLLCYTFINGNTNYKHFLKLTYFINTLLNICFIGAFLLIFLYWISVISNIFNIQQHRLLTNTTRFVFLGVFFIPNLFIRIVQVSLYLSDHTTQHYVKTIENVSKYYMYLSCIIVTSMLWGYLAFHFVRAASQIKGRLLSFTIIAYLFSITFIILVTISTMVQPSKNSIVYEWVVFIFLIVLYLQLLFFVHRIRWNKIHEYFKNRSSSSPPKRSKHTNSDNSGSSSSTNTNSTSQHTKTTNSYEEGISMTTVDKNLNDTSPV